MFKMKKYVGIALLAGLVAALGISSVAAAQSSVTPTRSHRPRKRRRQPLRPTGWGRGAAQSGGAGGCGEGAGHDDR